MTTNRDDWFSVPTLKARGWTETLIREHLGGPDATIPNPVYRSKAKMRLYARSRVETVEASPTWIELRMRVTQRKAAAAKAVQTKRQALQASVEALVIEVPIVPWDVLIRDACDHYNARQWDRECWDSLTATRDSSPEFLARITVNYLRHQLTSYEEQLAKIYGRVGVRDTYVEIKEKVLVGEEHQD